MPSPGRRTPAGRALPPAPLTCGVNSAVKQSPEPPDAPAPTAAAAPSAAAYRNLVMATIGFALTFWA